MAGGDCSVTECRRWRRPYQTGKTMRAHAKHYKHHEDGCTAPGVYFNGSILLSHSGNVVMRIGIHTHTFCGETGLVDKVFTIYTGSRGFDSHRQHMSELFFWSNRPEYAQPVFSELENSGIRMVVGDCSVTETAMAPALSNWRNCTYKMQKHYKHNEDRPMVLGVHGHGPYRWASQGMSLRELDYNNSFWYKSKSWLTKVLYYLYFFESIKWFLEC